MIGKIHRSAAGDVGASGVAARGGPGKTTLVEQLMQRSGGGSSVPAPIRARTEQATGADLSGVRLHTGGESADAAASVGARAYAVGQDVHFGAGHYQPGTPGGDRLIAHELAHTIQQQGAPVGPQYQLEVSRPGDAAEAEADHVADAVTSGTHGAAPAMVSQRGAAIARDPDPGATGWGPGDLNAAYKTPRTANYQIKPEERAGAVDGYRQKIQGDPSRLASASDVAGGKGTKIDAIHLVPDDIYYIVGQHLDDVGKGREKEVQKYLDQMVDAFRIMKIDTVEAMALYLAHAAGETMFAYLTEGQIKDSSKTPDDKRQAFLDDPTQVNEAQDAAGPRRYANVNDGAHGTVDPAGKIDPTKNPTYADTFIGRGPVQVTHDYEYVKCLVILEEMAKTASDADRATIDEAVAAIKKDPRQAANPQYSFLFSAAFMHESGGVQASTQVTPGNARFSGRKNDPSASWVAGGGFDIYANYDAATTALAAAKKGGKKEEIDAAQAKFNEWAGHRSRAMIKAAAYVRGLERLKQILARQDQEGGYKDSAGAWQPTTL